MPDLLTSVKSEIESLLAHHRSRPHVDAMMAAAVLVAAADGEVSLAERVQRDRALEKLAERGDVDAIGAAALFDQLAREIAESPDAGRERAWRLVDEAAQGADEKFRCVLVRTACAIAMADGELGDAESRCIESLCSRLELTRSACGV